MRAFAGRFTASELGEELRTKTQTYGYLAVSTAVAFASFGAVLGRVSDRLDALSRTDALTGLRNRLELVAQLDYWIHQRQRHESTVSLILIDVDHLKEINDHHGHAAGDAALMRVAQAIRRTIRRIDIAGRLGGDEFCIVAPLTDLEQASALATRVVADVQRQSGGTESVSVGVAVVNRAEIGSAPRVRDSLIANADAALYRAKQSGRGHVALHEGPSRARSHPTVG
jgi:diguanylate cyclase (GGDEF)-like protein